VQITLSPSLKETRKVTHRLHHLHLPRAHARPSQQPDHANTGGISLVGATSC